MNNQNGDRLDDGPTKAHTHTRRPHRKTKTGCQSCKRRKIKCDEQRPECDNCIKHSLSCEYTLKQENNGPQPFIIPPIGPSELKILDLELLHFFCTETALTYHHNTISRRVMSINVPQLGFSHSYVMHSILALSALHIAKVHPERRSVLIPYASHHHEVGLQKASLILQTLDQHNASALYVFTALTLLFTIGGTSLHISENHAILGNGGVAEWIILARQSYSIVRIAGDILRAGPISPIFVHGTRRHRKRVDDYLDEEGNRHPLRNEHLLKMSTLVDQNTHDPSEKHAYAETIYQLGLCYAAIESLIEQGEELETSDIMTWPYKVTELYLDLLQQGKQEALIILAFFAVLPSRFKDSWFLEDFGISLITRIYPMIDETHLPWIEWPLLEVRWVSGPSKVHSRYGTPPA